jgi:hypothetical protein
LGNLAVFSLSGSKCTTASSSDQRRHLDVQQDCANRKSCLPQNREETDRDRTPLSHRLTNHREPAMKRRLIRYTLLGGIILYGLLALLPIEPETRRAAVAGVIVFAVLFLAERQLNKSHDEPTAQGSEDTKTTS